jgi:serine/threonine protein kinase
MPASRENWERIKLLFDAALAHPPQERGLFLRENSPYDELRIEVERLLAEHEEAAGFLSDAIVGNISTDSGSADQRIRRGQVLAGRFKIIRLIAAGGMGEVYEADDLEMHEAVALKMIRQDRLLQADALTRFKREVQLARKITHPNVCRINDIFRHVPTSGDDSGDEIVFLSMELLRGETLAERLQRTGRLPTGEALEIVLQLVAALSAAHRAGVLHRDFKPGNVLLVRIDGDPPRVRAVVTDFGLARSFLQDPVLANGTTEPASQLIGTLPYMAPEQLEGHQATVASDIYALGVVMCETVTGRRPPRYLADHPAEHFAPSLWAPGLGWRWDSAILKCLQHNPKNRFPRIDDVATTLSGSGPKIDKQQRVLEAAAPKEGSVNRAIEVIAMVRVPSSKGLRVQLETEPTSLIKPDDVRERPFSLLFHSRPDGTTEPLEVCLRLDSPDFDPPKQEKKISVPPDGDSEPCTFLAKPCMAGELILNLELIKDEKVVVSRPIRTHVLQNELTVTSEKVIVSIPITIVVEAPWTIPLTTVTLPQAVIGAPSPIAKPAMHGLEETHAFVAPSLRFSPPDVLADRFKIIKKIGIGGAGSIYEAEDLALHERVEVKSVFRSNLMAPRLSVHLKREIELVREITHPNVRRIFDIFVHRDTEMLVSGELLSGQTLDMVLRTQGRFSEREALPLIEQMAEGLTAIHKAGIIHWDFRPVNISLVPSSSKQRLRVVITDLEGPILLSACTEGASMIQGTLDYMSPEQIKGLPATVATNVYAFGLVMYEIVTGSRPFEASDTKSKILKQLSESAVPPGRLVPILSLPWDEVILKCLAKDPADRPQTIEAAISPLMSDRRLLSQLPRDATDPHA